MNLKSSAILLLLIFASVSEAQIKTRSQNLGYYTGAGYRFVIFTDPNASEAFPFFDFSGQAFVKELDGFFGLILNETVAVEFNPSYMFSNNYGGEDQSDGGGYYFTSGSGINRYYLPISANMYAIPLNVRAKYFPFSKDYSSFLNKFFIGAGGGAMYISEEMEHRVYTDDSQLDYLGLTRNSDNFWTYNLEVMAGLATVSNFGVGFEAGFRFVSLSPADKTKPLTTTISSNFNNVDLTMNIIYNF